MKNKILVKKVNNSLHPVNQDYIKQFNKMPNNEFFYIKDVTICRNHKLHRKFFALVKIFANNNPYFIDTENARNNILLGIGYSKTEMTIYGIQQKAKSISYKDCDNLEFTNIYEKSVKWVTLFLKLNEYEVPNEIENAIKEIQQHF